jgi:hypothetical protein
MIQDPASGPSPLPPALRAGLIEALARMLLRDLERRPPETEALARIWLASSPRDDDSQPELTSARAADSANEADSA